MKARMPDWLMPFLCKSHRVRRALLPQPAGILVRGMPTRVHPVWEFAALDIGPAVEVRTAQPPRPGVLQNRRANRTLLPVRGAAAHQRIGVLPARAARATQEEMLTRLEGNLWWADASKVKGPPR
jgi:hypothetical protein